MELSIIIVNYKVEKQLLACLDSIKAKIKGIKFEVIVVENDPATDLGSVLKKFKFAKYVRSKTNLGFGGGNNLGAGHAIGEYLFFLNPDTQIVEGSLSLLLKEFEKNKVGIVAPLLLHKDGKLFEHQGLMRLTPIRAIFSLSIINKIFPKNPISAKYWMLGVDRSKRYQVDAVPGTAFVIKRNIFEKLGGFDKNFFLYFEEMDLCNRVLDYGLKIYMSPTLKVLHVWGESTKKGSGISEIFRKSRFYYFEKYYGPIIAFITTWLMDFNLSRFIIISILSISAFLRFYKPYFTPFIADQGWFYLSAKQLLSGHIPLIGITSSHTWLHQGPFWTYILALGLIFTNFNPTVGVYIAGIFGVFATFLIYKIGKEYFDERFGLLAALLYAASPLIVSNERMAYHTAPISFFVCLLIYFVLRWIKGSSFSFCASLLVMSILYNFELATVVLWPALLILLFYGSVKKEKCYTSLFNYRTGILASFSLLIPMLPVVIYDFNHGFVQTVKFAIWLIYSPVSFLFKHEVKDNSFFIFFVDLHLKRFVFLPSTLVSLGLILTAILFQAFSIKKILSPLGIVFLFTIIPTFAFLFARTPSAAYLPMLFPGLILSITFLISSLINKKRIIGIAIVLILVLLNIYLQLSNDFYMGKPPGRGASLTSEIKASTKILLISSGEKYNLVLKSSGPLINYSTDNYKYLTWWLGKNPPVNYKVSKQILIYRSDKETKVSEIRK